MNTYNEFDNYQPTQEDLNAYTACMDDFSGHPAYEWVTSQTALSEDDCEAFTVYSNMYRNIDTGHFSKPIDAIYAEFRMYGMEP